MANATIVCGSNSIIATVGVEMNVTCTSTGFASISPVLPKGLTFSNNVIRGTPTEPVPITSYTITTQRDSGTFTIGGSI